MINEAGDIGLFRRAALKLGIGKPPAPEHHVFVSKRLFFDVFVGRDQKPCRYVAQYVDSDGRTYYEETARKPVQTDLTDEQIIARTNWRESDQKKFSSLPTAEQAKLKASWRETKELLTNARNPTEKGEARSRLMTHDFHDLLVQLDLEAECKNVVRPKDTYFDGPYVMEYTKSR